VLSDDADARHGPIPHQAKSKSGGIVPPFTAMFNPPLLKIVILPNGSNPSRAQAALSNPANTANSANPAPMMYNGSNSLEGADER